MRISRDGLVARKENDDDDDDDERWEGPHESHTHLAIDSRSDGCTSHRWRPQRIGWCPEDVPIDCEWDWIDPDRLRAKVGQRGLLGRVVLGKDDVE